MDFHFPQVFETIAEAAPDREALVFGKRRFTFRELRDRSRRLARYLVSRGLTIHGERSELSGHESGQDHLAIYLYNGNEYIEGMLGAFMARTAPLNVNYRYVEEELRYLFEDSCAKAVVYHAEFAPRIAAIRNALPQLEVLIQVADDSGEALLPGAVDYEEALASMEPELPDLDHSPDDLYILYTGGTTGMPKGVLWRSADIYVAAMGGRRLDGMEMASLDEIFEYAKNGPGIKAVQGPPLMHGAAQWVSFINFGMGNTLIFCDEVKRFAAAAVLEVIEREEANTLTIVGDAFAKPLIDALRRGERDVSSLILIGSGGAPLSANNKRALLECLPDITIMDGIGSSETGAQATNPSNKGTGVSTGDFAPMPGSCVVSEDLTRVLAPGADEIGWFAQQGRVPLGYLGDAEKTARTFPEIGGVRYSVPGDRARIRSDGSYEFPGLRSGDYSLQVQGVGAETADSLLAWRDFPLDREERNLREG